MHYQDPSLSSSISYSFYIVLVLPQENKFSLVHNKLRGTKYHTGKNNIHAVLQNLHPNLTHIL